MILAFSLYDSAAEAYAPPVFARTRAEAIRSLASGVADSGQPLCQHAEHFQLFEVGSFDQHKGVLSAHVAPVHVINAWELKGAPRLVANE